MCVQGLRQDVLGPWAPSSVLTYRTLGNLKCVAWQRVDCAMVAVVAHQCGVVWLLCRSFRWTFLAYLLLPTVLLIVKVSVCVFVHLCALRGLLLTPKQPKTTMFVSQITVLSWRFEWLATLLDELLLLYVFLHVLFTFRPLKPMDFSSVRQGRAGQHGVVGQVGLGRGG